MNNTSIYTWIESHRYLKEKEPDEYELTKRDYDKGLLYNEKTGETTQIIKERGTETKFHRKMKRFMSWTSDKQCTQNFDKVFHRLVKEIDKTIYNNEKSYYSFDEVGNNEEDECDAGHEWGYHVSIKAIQDAYDCLHSIYPGDAKVPDYVNDCLSIRNLYELLIDKYKGDRKAKEKKITFSPEYSSIVKHLQKDYHSKESKKKKEESEVKLDYFTELKEKLKKHDNSFSPIYSQQFFDKFIFPEFNVDSFSNICAFVYNEEDALTICNTLKEYKGEIIILCSSKILKDKTTEYLKYSKRLSTIYDNVKVECLTEEFLETYKGTVGLYIHIHPHKSTYMHSDYFRIIDVLLNHLKGKAVVCRTLGVFNRMYPSERENINKVNNETFHYLTGILYKFINFNPGKHFFPKNKQPNLYCTMYIDYSKIHNDIELDNFGDRSVVHSVNDCNIFGYPKETIQHIFNVLSEYPKKLKDYICNNIDDVSNDDELIKISQKITTCYNHPTLIDNDCYFKYNPEIYSEFYRSMYSDDMDCRDSDLYISLSHKQAENYKHNVMNCDIFPFIGIMTAFHMDATDSFKFVPMLCNKLYTSQGAYEELGISPEYVVVIKNILRQFSRYSAWFRAYNGIEDEEINDSSVPLF